MRKCVDCDRSVSPAWEQTDEWKNSHFCPVCLFGEEFYLQVAKACRQTRMTVDPRSPLRP